MLKYKEKYQVRYERDNHGKIYNRDDNYISCRAGGKIFRKSSNILEFISPKRIQVIKKDPITKEVIKDYTPLLLDLYDTDAEREITFKESNLEKLEDLFKIRKRRHLSEEAREKARIRFQKMWADKGQSNVEVTDEDLESEDNENNDDIEEDTITEELD